MPLIVPLERPFSSSALDTGVLGHRFDGSIVARRYHRVEAGSAITHTHPRRPREGAQSKPQQKELNTMNSFYCVLLSSRQHRGSVSRLRISSMLVNDEHTTDLLGGLV